MLASARQKQSGFLCCELDLGSVSVTERTSMRKELCVNVLKGFLVHDATRTFLQTTNRKGDISRKVLVPGKNRLQSKCHYLQ